MTCQDLISNLQRYDAQRLVAIQRHACDARPHLEQSPQIKERVLFLNEETRVVFAFDEGQYPGWTRIGEVLVL